MKNKTILLLSFLLFFLGVKAQNVGRFYFSNLGLEDGLSQISVVKILQDSKGFMWFGTRNGLNRYDGSEFIVYKHAPEDSLTLSDNNILSLAEDADRNLWVGTSRGLCVMDMKTEQVRRFDSPKYGNIGELQIGALFVDSDNRLWVGTNRGLFCYVPESDEFQSIDLNGAIRGESIGAIYETKKHQLLIGTNAKGLLVCDMDAKVLRHVPADGSRGALLESNISTLYEDSQGRIWGGGNDCGLFQMDLKTGTVKTFHTGNSALTTNSIRCVGEVNGLLLVGTFDGLYVMNLSTLELSQHSDRFLGTGDLPHFSIYSLLVDRMQTVWVGTYAGGVGYSNKFNNRFAFHDPVEIFDTFFGIYGNAVCTEDSTLYISTEGRGLLGYDLRTDTYQNFLIEDAHLQYNQNIIKSLLRDGDVLYCGTSRGAIYKFDIRTKQYALFYKFPNGMSIYGMLPDGKGGMWIVGSNSDLSLTYLDKDKKLSQPFPKGPGTPGIGSARCLFRLSDDVLLVGTRSNGLVKYDIEKQEFTFYNNRNPRGPEHLLNNYVTSITRDSKGRIWVGTFGGGMAQFDEGRGIVKSVTGADGLLSNDVCAIVEDSEHKLWLSLNNGIAEYFPEDGKIINYSSQNGIGIEEFSPHSGTLLPGGELYFSGNNGFVTFSPRDLQINPYVPPLALTHLYVNNKLIAVGDDTGILPTAVLDDVERIDLAYDENNLSIGYCALNFIFAQQNQYAVFLKGYDEEWNYMANNHRVYYTNLSPGTYEFNVRAANNDRIWNQEPRRLRVVVHPPFWRTWYAYTFYALLFVSVIALIMYYMLKKQKLESELSFQQKERRQLETFHQEKIRMFTNFSHELRTPLTLIIAPLQELMSTPVLASAVKNKIGLIHTNAQRLLLLVNQFLDLRKNEEGKLSLHVTHTDFYPFMLEIYYAFNYLAQSKQVGLKFDQKEESAYVWLDKVLIEKVVFNLLSNAIKFTPSGGEVTFSFAGVGREELPPSYRDAVALPAETEFIRLRVADTGVGIPEGEVDHIFNPFHQVDSNSGNLKNLGTGIGLSLTNSIVHLHHGYIEVLKNTPRGTVFNVYLPVSSCAYDEVVLAKEEEYKEEVVPLAEDARFDIERRHTVLLAEDNDEVRRYVKGCLDPYFYVLEARDGQEALDLCYEKYPNLIVSDIMMPRMDGLELCHRVKDDMQLGHIPVILVTAQSMVMQIKDGYLAGADDYIVKPFSMDVLICRIQNLLEAREKLKKMFGKKFSPEAMDIEIVSNDDRFTQKFYEVVEKHLNDPHLNIETVCKEMGFSRANFYRKLKEITDLKPIDLIRNKRLEVAAKLLAESDYSVSEVANYTGFNTHSYFTASFTKMYGYSPSEWVQKHKMERGEI